MKKQLIIITGATGVGKTDLILKLADRCAIEIINADTGQMFMPLTIGTAKPDWRQQTIPHHLFDIVTSPKNFSIIQFRQLVVQLLEEIWQRGRTPVVVGGSTFYIKSLFWVPRAASNSNLTVVNQSDLWQQLNVVDPVRASQLHPNDTYRLQRALAIWQGTGRQPSDFTPHFQAVATKTALVILTRERTDLYQRINERVLEMIHNGWIKEVERLDPDWKAFLRYKKIIGYELILNYLERKENQNELINKIQQRVRNYAKRQQTFWRHLQRQLELEPAWKGQMVELNLTNKSELAEERLLNLLIR